MEHLLDFSFEIGRQTQDIEDLPQALCDILRSVVHSFDAKIIQNNADFSHVVIQAPNRLALFKITLKLKEFFISHMQFWDRQYRSIDGQHTHLTSNYLFCSYQIEKSKVESLTIMCDSQAIKQAKTLAAKENTSHTS